MKKIVTISLVTIAVVTLSAFLSKKDMIDSHNLSITQTLQPAKLFATLPDYCPTPDAFEIAPDGSLILSCPNFADKNQSGVLLRITKAGEISKLADVPVLKESGKSQPMGIAYDEDGALYVCDNQGKGRLLRMVFENNTLKTTDVVAYNFKSINGIRYNNGALYVTQTKLPKFKTKQITSGVYRFKTTDRDIKVNNDATDSQLIYTEETKNPDRQAGLDGLVFDNDGNLLVGNLGDAVITKLFLSPEGKVEKKELYASLPKASAPDGINIDAIGNLYVAGFANNQIFKIDTERHVTTIAEYPDNDGTNGGIDQPADLIVYNNKLVISNFDLMVAKGMKNTKHGKPYTLSYIDLAE
ncbi:SMP-30/gluconolactonase/LRE family protein [uncultured Algibacter sp.]|uniref:Vgb family protein n=1 Tax=uncultured Algibacter sp. TaxID=298659 RepID=UPI003216F69D